MIEIELELIWDIDLYLFIENGMRGGISYFSKRYSKANNKYMKSYDANKPNRCITYLDGNNLFGWAMSRCLAYGGFKWLNQKEFDEPDVNSIGENSPIRYILEVDLEYHDELYELHNDYSLAPEKLEICNQIIVVILQMNMT